MYLINKEPAIAVKNSSQSTSWLLIPYLMAELLESCFPCEYRRSKDILQDYEYSTDGRSTRRDRILAAADNNKHYHQNTAEINTTACLRSSNMV